MKLENRGDQFRCREFQNHLSPFWDPPTPFPPCSLTHTSGQEKGYPTDSRRGITHESDSHQAASGQASEASPSQPSVHTQESHLNRCVGSTAGHFLC